MRGLVFKGNRQLALDHFADPEPGEGEVVLEIKASGMCGTDLHWYRHPNPSDIVRELGLKDLESRGIDPAAPIIGGHEPCGVIAALGPGVDPRTFPIGKRVIVYHYKGCNFCDSCRTGWTQMCDQGAVIYGVVAHGGHADYMKVPASSLVDMPDDLSFASGAAIACGTGTAYGALLRLDVSAQDSVAIFGLSPVGLSAAQFAAAMGAQVIGVDINAERVARSREFGVAHAIDASRLDPIEEIHKLTRGKGATCAIDCAGGDVPKQQAVRSTAPWGRIALVAVGGSLSVDGMKDIIVKQRTVIGSYTLSSVEMRECAEFVADRGIAVDKLFTDRWPLDQAEQAYAEFDRQDRGKAVFVA